MKYFFIGFLFFSSRCIAISHDLGSGYILGYGTDNQDRIIYIQKNNGGEEITYYEDSNKSKRYFKNEEGIITSYISQIAFDNKYLIIDQKPLDSICDCNFEYFHKTYGDSDRIGFSQRCDNGIKNALVHYYYIIDKEKNIVTGPMSKEKLIEKLMQLGFNENLKFRYYSY